MNLSGAIFMGMLKTFSLIGGVHFKEKCASKQKNNYNTGFQQTLDFFTL